MFDNIHEKLKVLAIVTTIVGIIASCIFGFILIMDDDALIVF